MKKICCNVFECKHCNKEQKMCDLDKVCLKTNEEKNEAMCDNYKSGA
jgi:hypothetical protein